MPSLLSRPSALVRRIVDPWVQTLDVDPIDRVTRELRRVQNLMNIDPFAGLLATEPVGLGLTRYMPDFDIRENENEFLISADLPGVKQEDVDVQVSGRRLQINGKRETERREETDRWYCAERSFGTFSRIFTLPEGADLDNVKADLDNGILTIRVPKGEGARQRRIEVQGAAKQIAQQAEPRQAEAVGQKEREKVEV